jgi:hypothetical protein
MMISESVILLLKLMLRGLVSSESNGSIGLGPGAALQVFKIEMFRNINTWIPEVARKTQTFEKAF